MLIVYLLTSMLFTSTFCLITVYIEMLYLMLQFSRTSRGDWVEIPHGVNCLPYSQFDLQVYDNILHCKRENN